MPHVGQLAIGGLSRPVSADRCTFDEPCSSPDLRTTSDLQARGHPFHGLTADGAPTLLSISLLPNFPFLPIALQIVCPRTKDMKSGCEASTPLVCSCRTSERCGCLPLPLPSFLRGSVASYFFLSGSHQIHKPNNPPSMKSSSFWRFSWSTSLRPLD